MILELLERLTALVYIESSVLGCLILVAVGCHMRTRMWRKGIEFGIAASRVGVSLGIFLHVRSNIEASEG